MSNERLVICGELSAPTKTRGKEVVSLSLDGGGGNVTLKLGDITQRMVAALDPALIDLLEIASYVYCADQATTRGGETSREYGAKWRRQFKFHVPVREPDLWSSGPVRAALCKVLGFLSDDEYDFSFDKLRQPSPVDSYLDFGSGPATGFQAEEVALFSGGLDSLGGAIREAVVDKRSVALVSHRSSPKIDNKQRALVRDLGGHISARHQPFHVPVWINKNKALSREYTQRTRSFLYASLGVVVARIFDLWRLRFYENGVVSINLPVSAQVLGGRATRTTHPQILNGFAEVFSAVLQKPFAVENPFRWMTKAEVVKSIRDAGCGDLIKHTVSCTRVWEMSTLKTHCGICSQCIDRRFGTLAAGCPDAEDPEEMYEVDLLRGERRAGDSRTMVESYVRTAQKVRGMSDAAFFTEFGEVHRVTTQIRDMSVDEAATRILSLYKRHADEVGGVITAGIEQHAQEISDGKLPNTSLLILALPDQYRKPLEAEAAELPPAPVLVLDEIRDGESNNNVVARVVGHGEFSGVDKKIGSRELFFVSLLFRSERLHTFEGTRYTAVTAEDACQELLNWSRVGYLKFEGKDKDNPANRVQKMWGEFVRQIEKITNLMGVFISIPGAEGGQRLYLMRLVPDQTQIAISSIPALFQKPTPR